MPRNNWTREETILALALYCKVPFGRINKTNPQIVALANNIGRTPSALAMKMCNFARFDPELSRRGVSGLVNGGKLDKTIWDEFYQNMEELYAEVENITSGASLILPPEEIEIPAGEDVATTSKARKGQAFFRNAVLSAYDNTCCITGINIPKLLQASHIKSWSDSDPLTERTNPINGLCLNALHHKAFDNGIITIDTNYRILVSRHAKEHYSSEIFTDYFERYEGQQIHLPNRFFPSKDLILFHNSGLADF